MGLLGTLFGSPKTVNTITDGLTRGIDAVVFTPEEKANFIKDMVLKLQDQYLPRALSRRIIAVLITAIFCLFCIVGLIFACFNKPDIVDNIIKVAEAFKLGWIMGAIVVFYFGYYGAMNVLKKDKPNA